MKIKRREFIQTAASAVGGLALAGCSAEPNQVTLHPMTDGISPITQNERDARIDHAKKLMQQNKIEAIFVEPGSSLFYFTGIRWGRSERMFAWILPAKGRAAFVCPAFEEEKASEQIPESSDIHIWEEHESPYLRVQQILHDRGISGGTLGMEETVRFFLINQLRQQIPPLQITSADPVIVECRMIKSPAEIKLMQRANDITIVAYQTALHRLQGGKTQHDVAEDVSSAFNQLGVRGGAFVQFGKYSAYPHGSRQLQHLQEGDVLLIDGGCSVEGYRSDISRTIVFGNPTKKQRTVWNLIRSAQDAAREAAKPGALCEAVDTAARKVILDGGYGPDYKYFSHRLGHGIGLDGHEWTYLVRGNKMPLRPGMCFSNEPGIYIYGEFGMRLEDCMYVTEDGVALFTEHSPSIEDPFA
jgi:Xaa-Pro dipeptidase